jgi:hypothetical protein
MALPLTFFAAGMYTGPDVGKSVLYTSSRTAALALSRPRSFVPSFVASLNGLLSAKAVCSL